MFMLNYKYGKHLTGFILGELSVLLSWKGSQWFTLLEKGFGFKHSGCTLYTLQVGYFIYLLMFCYLLLSSSDEEAITKGIYWHKPVLPTLHSVNSTVLVTVA